MLKLIGNYGRSKQGISGFGNANLHVNTAAWMAVISDAKTGLVGYVPGYDILVPGYVQMGVFFQSSVPVEVRFTIFDVGAAIDESPEVQAGISWVEPLNVTPSAIQRVEAKFSALKITFSAPGALFIQAI